MPIASVAVHPLAAPQPAGSGRAGVVASLVVEVVTHDGLAGFGEAYSPRAPQAAGRVVSEVLAPVLAGADETAVGAAWDTMRAALVAPISGAAAEAVSAVDIALWDLLGQRLGQPVHRLLGGHGRTRVPAYGSFIAWVDDDAAAAQARRAAALGFRAIKVKVSPPLDAALARVALVRAVVGEGIELVADPNGAFDAVEALRFARRLAELGYLWLEEPLDPLDVAGLARLNGLGILPLAAGESEFDPRGAARLLEARAVGLLQPDCGRIGGITGFMRAVHAASAFGIPFAPHHAGGPVKAAAALHLAAALPGFRIMECSLHRTELHDGLTREPVADPRQLDDAGTLPVPQGPGLGITIDRAMLARLTRH